jgi:outer membrane biosynthesis protein TonB
MRQRAQRWAVVAALLTAAPVLTGCTGEGEDRTLPSTPPSIERTTGEQEPRSAEPTRTRESRTPDEGDEPEPTRTEKPEPTRTEKPEPTRTEKPEPAETEKPATEKPEPAGTEKPKETTTTEKTPAGVASTRVEVTVTVVPTATATTETTPPPASPSAVAAAAEDDSGGILGWILLILLFAGLAAVLLLNRPRRSAAWDAEAGALAAETRMVVEARLAPVLALDDPVRRATVWPRVRGDLASLGTGWGRLAGQPADAPRQAMAGGVALLLRDLTAAVDAENDALAAGQDWRALRPEVEQILDSLDATMMPAEPGQPSAGGPSTTTYP